MEHPQQQQQHQQTSKEPVHHQQEEVIFQRKRRTGWRHCALCQGPESDGLEASSDPMLHVCACPSRGVVHYSCQGRAMAASGLIACPVCGASYAETNSGRGGVRFHATPKSLVDYVRDDPGARASLATLASMLLSALLALVTLWRTLTVDWATVIGPEVAAGLQLPLSKEGLKADLRVLLLVNGKFVMPLLPVYLTASKAVVFAREYRAWRETHFNVLVLPFRGAPHPEESPSHS